MNETTPAGGARPAIPAHSKDSTTGNRSDRGGFPDNLSELSEKASEGVERVKASVREATGNARDALSGGAREALAESGRAAGQAAEAVRDQPFIAMAITGAICLVFGVLLGRR